MKPTFNHSKPYGEIIGMFDEVPGARYTQNGRYFGATFDLLDETAEERAEAARVAAEAVERAKAEDEAKARAAEAAAAERERAAAPPPASKAEPAVESKDETTVEAKPTEDANPADEKPAAEAAKPAATETTIGRKARATAPPPAL